MRKFWRINIISVFIFYYLLNFPMPHKAAFASGTNETVDTIFVNVNINNKVLSHCMIVQISEIWCAHHIPLFINEDLRLLNE